MSQKTKVLIDQTRLITGHKARGSGTYINNLVNSLKSESLVRLVDSYSDEPDVVHYPYFDPFFLTLPSRFTRPTVITVHDLIPIDYPKIFPKGIKGAIKWQIQKQKLKKADAIITDSLHSKKRISVLTGISPEKIYSIPLAADPIFVKKQKKELIQTQKKYKLPDKFVLYLGDINPNKNVIRLIQAAESFKIRLFLAGRPFSGHSAEVIKIKKMVANSKNSQIIGEIESAKDLVDIYNLAHLTVVPSWDEGFGFPILESMACGTPVATSNISCLPEVGATAARYFDPYSKKSIIDTINQITTLNKSEYNQLSNDSIKNNQKFTWEKTAKLTSDVYQQIVH